MLEGGHDQRFQVGGGPWSYGLGGRRAGRRFRLAGGATAAVVAAGLTAACGSAGGTHTRQTVVTLTSPSRAAGPTATPTPTAAALPKLTTRQLAGQRVIYSYQGLTPPASLLARIRAGEAAGVIFFKPNYRSRAQLRAAIAQLTKAAGQSPVHAPLLLMTDQEGGQIRRLPGAPELSAKQVGRAAHPVSAAADAGSGAAGNLRGVGMNLNLAPVLDVYRRPGDFDDQTERSFSSNPGTVGALGAAFLTAQQKAGVAATVKHFPGLGAAGAGANTDLGPVTLHVSASTLRSVDELPYKAAIKVGTRLVMVSWARYPALDANRPAGLSSKIVQGELRGRLGFTGVTITDALEAGALKAYGSTGHRGVLAAGAGMDLLLYSAQNAAEGSAGLDALAAALRSGQLDSGAFRTAAQRVLTLRSGLPA